MKTKNFILILVLFGFISTCFANDWYVCTGSFSKKENAIERVKILYSHDLSCFIGTSLTNDNKTLHRVFIDKEFNSFAEADSYRNELSKNNEISKIDKTNFWCIQYTGSKDRFFFIEKEIIKEVPVEKIVEKEVIKEIPVERIIEKEVIKEIPVEVIVEKEVIKEIPAEINVEKNVEESLKKSEKIIEDKKSSPKAITETVDENQNSDEIKLEVNTEENESIVSEDYPYSVLIHSYKEQQKAEKDQKRLKEEEIDSYILKEYDEKTLFSFDLHSGAFESEEEAEEHAKIIESKGIIEPQISDFNEIKDKIEKYNEIVTENEVKTHFGKTEYPGMLNSFVVDFLEYFPVNKDLDITNLYVSDIYNRQLVEEDFDYDDYSSTYVEDFDSLKTIGYATYVDPLFDKKIFVYAALGENQTFVDLDEFEGIDISLYLNEDEIRCKLNPEDDLFTLYGKNESNDYFLYMKFLNFDTEGLMKCLDAIEQNENLTVYSQLRRTLFIQSDSKDRMFISFRFEKLNESYVRQKNYANWSFGFLGHYIASTFMHDGEDYVNIAIFDMDYDYAAEKQMDLLVKEKYYRPSESIEDTDCWYVSNLVDEKGRLVAELCFTKDSDLFAAANHSQDEDDLQDMVRQLKLWEDDK